MRYKEKPKTYMCATMSLLMISRCEYEYDAAHAVDRVHADIVQRECGVLDRLDERLARSLMKHGSGQHRSVHLLVPQRQAE